MTTTACRSAGRRFDDLGVLAIARAFEAIRAFEARPWPEPPAA
jgi:aspartyl-tRNA(Asn)/glutamyl-tRNA(Gln) amidotransferase subunit A